MKQINRVLSTFLAFVFVLSAVMACPITAKAYNYTIKITLAASSDEKAEFIPLEEMISSKALNISNGEATINGETLTLTGLNYGDKVTFNPQAAITIGEDSKYYVKGMRVAGTNNVLAAGALLLSSSLSEFVSGEASCARRMTSTGPNSPSTLAFRWSSGV